VIGSSAMVELRQQSESMKDHAVVFSGCIRLSGSGRFYESPALKEKRSPNCFSGSNRCSNGARQRRNPLLWRTRLKLENNIES
jgi:hypothetical protein